jgi:hypothetical protein
LVGTVVYKARGLLLRMAAAAIISCPDTHSSYGEDRNAGWHPGKELRIACGGARGYREGIGEIHDIVVRRESHTRVHALIKCA